MHCKYGKLKNPTGNRRCRKRRPGRRAGGRSRTTCKYGKLKNPVGKRVCRKKRWSVKHFGPRIPPGGRKALAKRAAAAAATKIYPSGNVTTYMNGYRRRRRSRR